MGSFSYGLSRDYQVVGVSMCSGVFNSLVTSWLIYTTQYHVLQDIKTPCNCPVNWVANMGTLNG